MRINKIIPSGFLLLLLIVIVFIGGLRYGKRVEVMNKSVQYISPTQKQEETVEVAGEYDSQIQSFLLYQNSQCGIEFLYPDNLSVNESSSQSATFNKGQRTLISVMCGSKEKDTTKMNNSTSKDILFKGETITILTNSVEGKKMFTFTLSHPGKKDSISVQIIPEYMSLFERTLTFEISQ